MQSIYLSKDFDLYNLHQVWIIIHTMHKLLGVMLLDHYWLIGQPYSVCIWHILQLMCIYAQNISSDHWIADVHLAP